MSKPTERAGDREKREAAEDEQAFQESEATERKAHKGLPAGTAIPLISITTTKDKATCTAKEPHNLTGHETVSIGGAEQADCNIGKAKVVHRVDDFAFTVDYDGQLGLSATGDLVATVL